MRVLVRLMQFTTVLVSLLGVAGVHRAGANTIFVTTLQQKISSTGGCSLQEAIYSANLHDSVAVAFVDSNGVDQLIPTECVPGSGDDLIVLPSSGVFLMSSIVDDAHNFTGPTATPIITSTITIQGNGATLKWVNASLNARAFAVGTGGNLTISEMFITGFIAKGGNGADGGGGGMGAGGAIYVVSGALTVVDCTFANNGALGGAGSTTDQAAGGGGGGLGGNGGKALEPAPDRGWRGGGGGGSRADGTKDGGGTVFESITCGGPRGTDGTIGIADGGNAPCAGGGGGGGAGILLVAPDPFGTGGDGGNGAYGGGGGGGGQAAFSSRGGDGGFGGGGGAPGESNAVIGDGSSGGKGGYGGGGAGANGFGDGHAGGGGKFAGQGDRRHGGGGAALGGAIFSHFGDVTVQNSTFAGNFVIRGDSGGGAADNGQDGGAIFAVNGSLAVQDSTISGNTSTGGGAGIVVDLQDSSPPTLFTLQNTIISNPSADECFYTAGVHASGVGNLIVNNFGCPGVVSSSDPLLRPLFLNAPGMVPTMAITPNANSPAVDAADPGTSLPTDERGFPRPQGGGFDIGAYELCFETTIFGRDCLFFHKPPPPETATLTIQVSSAGAGGTNPVPGSYQEALASVVLLTATASPGFGFVNWSGGVADPSSAATSVVMDQDRIVTANFAPLAATMAGNIIAKAGPQNTRVWTLSLLDNGPGVTLGTTIHDFTLTQTFGAACTPVLTNAAAFPLSLGTLNFGQTGTTTVTLDFMGCAATARFTAKFTYSANNGAVSGFVIRTNQYQ